VNVSINVTENTIDAMNAAVLKRFRDVVPRFVSELNDPVFFASEADSNAVASD